MTTIVGTLPVTLQNGTVNDATQVMADLQFIVDQVNANALPTGSATTSAITTQAAETGGVSETLNVWIQREQVFPEEFGAASGTSTDYTTQLQNAINAASSRGMPLNFGGKTYRADCASPLILPVGGIEIFNGTLYLASAPGTTYPIICATSAGSNVTVTSPVSKYDTQLAVTSTTGMNVGDAMILESSDAWSTTGAVTMGEWITIMSVDDATHISIVNPARHNYSTSVHVRKPTTLPQVIMENFHMIGGGNGLNQNAMLLQYVNNVAVYNTDTVKFAARGIAYDYCRTIEIDGGNPGYGDDTTGLSYGHVISSATDSCKCMNPRGTQLRHVITAGGTTGIVDDYTTDNIVGLGMTDSTVDAHPAVNKFKAKDITHNGDIRLGASDGDGIVSQARHTIIEDYNLDQPGRNGVLVQPFCSTDKAVIQIGKGMVRQHGSLTSQSCFAVYIDATVASTAGIARAYIEDTDAESTNAHAGGINIQTGTVSVDSLRVGGGRVKTPLFALWLNAGNVAGKKITYADIQGGYYERTNTTAECVYAQGNTSGDVDFFKIHHCHTQGGNYGIRNLNGTNYDVCDNSIKGYGTAATLGLADNTASYTAGGTQIFQRNNT